jgi:teichuronic acid exporter
MKLALKPFLKNDILKELKTLFTGTVVAQTITIITLPVLAKLFSPAQFGDFALFFGIVNAIGFVAAGRFDAAVMLPKTEEKAKRLISIGIICCIGTALLSAFVILVASHFSFFKGFQQVISSFRFELPIAIFLVGFYTLLSSKYNRAKNYKKIAIARIAQNVVVSVFSISFGLLTFGSKGLVYGFMLGQLISILFLSEKRFESIDMSQTKDLMKEFKSFPLYSVPMVFLNTISINIMIFLLTLYVGSSFVGLYSQAYKAINYPLFIIASTISPIFFQKISVSENKRTIFLITFSASIIIGICLLFPIVIWGQQIFAFVFGEQWRLSGKIAAILFPMTVASFAITNVSTIFSATKSNLILLIWQIVYLSLSITIIYTFRNGDKLQLISYFSWFSTVMCILLAGIIVIIVKRKN